MVAHALHSQCKRAAPQTNENANQPKDGRTHATFTMEAMAAPTNLKPKRESARRRSHTRRIDNASGDGLKKIETQTRISPKNVAHAPHSQCAVAARTKLKPKRESARRRSHTRRIHNASGGGPNKIETQTQISPKTVAHAAFTMQAVAA